MSKNILTKNKTCHKSEEKLSLQEYWQKPKRRMTSKFEAHKLLLLKSNLKSHKEQPKSPQIRDGLKLTMDQMPITKKSPPISGSQACMQIDFFGFFIKLSTNTRLWLPRDNTICLRVMLIKLIKLKNSTEIEDVFKSDVQIKVNPLEQDAVAESLTMPLEIFELMKQQNVNYKLIFSLETTSQLVMSKAQSEDIALKLRAISKMYLGEFDIFKNANNAEPNFEVCLREASFAERNEPNILPINMFKGNATNNRLKFQLNWLPGVTLKNAIKILEYSGKICTHKYFTRQWAASFDENWKKEADNHVACRPKPKIPKRKYFRASTMLPLYAKQLTTDFDEEYDIPELYSNLHKIPVKEDEKYFMSLWNSHIFRQPYLGAHMLNVCETFIDNFGQEIIKNKLYRLFVLHLSKLFEEQVLKEFDILRLINKIKSLNSKQLAVCTTPGPFKPLNERYQLKSIEAEKVDDLAGVA